MNPKALEEELNALEEVDEHIVARLDILCCLQDITIKALVRAEQEKYDERTTRRTPIPAETTFAAGSTCNEVRYTNSRESFHNTYHTYTLTQRRGNRV